MDIRAIISKVSEAIVAAISGYVAIDQGFSLQGLLGALGTTSIAFLLAFYIYKDANANARMKHAQARQIEISNESAELKMLLEKNRHDEGENLDTSKE